jgi:hypothetical protein
LEAIRFGKAAVGETIVDQEVIQYLISHPIYGNLPR